MSESFARALDKVRRGWASDDNIRELTHADPEDIEAFRQTWFGLDDDCRYQLAARLADLAAQDPRLVFDALFEVLLDDDLAAVRALAVSGLPDIADEGLARRMTWLAQNDADAEVRAEAATALGAFLFGEDMADEPAQGLRREVEDTLLGMINTDAEDIQVRQRALEAYGYASDPFVDDVLRDAYDSDDDELRASAVFAMGRRMDEAWLPVVHREMRNESESMRLAAVYAASEIGSGSSVPHLLRVIGEDPDEDVRVAAVYALGEIETPETRRILEDLLEGNNVSIVNAADDALEMRGDAGGNSDLLMFDYGLFDEPDIRDDGPAGDNGNGDEEDQ